MTINRLTAPTAPLRACGKFDSDHIANKYTMEHIEEKDQGDIDNEEMLSVCIFDPTDPDIEESQIAALNEATGINLPYFR